MTARCNEASKSARHGRYGRKMVSSGPTRHSPEGSAWTDPDLIRRRYHPHPGPRRRNIYEFRPPELDLVHRLLDHIDWNRADRVLDAGCGLGAYFPWLRERVAERMIIGLDLIVPQLHHVASRSPGVPLVAGDVQSMPIASASLDVVLNAHMLYHVPDISAAIAEFRRVLRPGGQLLAIYDSITSQSELDQLFLDAGGTRTLNQIENRFSLENGHEFLDPWFDSVMLHTFDGEMVVNEAQPVLDALDLSHEVAEPYLKPGIVWSDMMARASERVRAVIAASGAFRLTETKAVFVCRV